MLSCWEGSCIEMSFCGVSPVLFYICEYRLYLYIERFFFQCLQKALWHFAKKSGDFINWHFSGNSHMETVQQSFKLTRAKGFRGPYSIDCAPSFVVRTTSLKSLAQSHSNVMCSALAVVDWKFVQMAQVSWTSWPQCPYMVKTLKNLLLQNCWGDCLETWH